MRFPTISQYIESLTNYDGLFRTLLSDAESQPFVCATAYHGMPDYRVGNFGAVFRVSMGGKPCAIKLFIRHRAARASAYSSVAKFLTSNFAESKTPYLADFKFLDQELYVYDPMEPTAEGGNYFPILLMEWIEGDSLSHHIEMAAVKADTARLKELCEKFEKMALWLLDQEFAHGDLKPENIIVRHSDDSLVLIDYDAMYVPEMAGNPMFEVGTPAFQHPLRYKMPLSNHVDDYSVALISLSMRALTLNPSLWHSYHRSDNLIMYPEEILTHSSLCYNELSKISELCQSPLFAIVGSPTPTVQNCSEALLWNHENKPFNLKPYRSDGRWGFNLDSGYNVIKPVYEAALEFSEDLAAVKIGGKWGYINTLGVFVISPIYNSALSFSGGLAAVSQGQKHGYINNLGAAVGGFHYDDALHMQPEGLALVRKRSKYGFVGKDGKIKITARYDFAQSFRYGVAVAMKNNRYGYINTAGRWVVKPIYDYAKNCIDGQLHVELEGKEITLPVPRAVL